MVWREKEERVHGEDLRTAWIVWGSREGVALGFWRLRRAVINMLLYMT